jgi:PAS domain S-box-containing protein
MVQDVTERRKIENAITQAKRDWENTFDTITDMITIHDENFNIIRSNKSASQILGLPWIEMGKTKCYTLYHGTDCPPENCPSCRSLVSGEPSVHELYEPHLGKHLEIRAIPRHDASGKPSGLIHVVRDITERKRAEEETAKLEARLREAQKMEVIGSLAGGVAHEVRNPLNAIMALTDALDQEVGGNPEYKAFMMHMRTQVDRLTTLMNDLLELGKPVEQGKLRTESLTEIVAISVDAWKHSKYGRGREVVTALSGPAEGAYILADAKKLQQVFINLLDNAAQHSPEGSPVRIEVLPPAGGRIEARVIDQGAGIPADILPRVFDTFFTTRRGGTGLGLSIVKHIIEKHGGTISLANNDPQPGCTVSVVLRVLEDIR